jgi:hypothetical protein
VFAREALAQRHGIDPNRSGTGPPENYYLDENAGPRHPYHDVGRELAVLL